MSKSKQSNPNSIAAAQEHLSQKVTRKLSEILNGINSGVQPSSEDMDALDRLSKLKAFSSAQRNQQRRKAEIGALCATTILFLGLSFLRLPSTSVDLDVRATKVCLTLPKERSTTLIPGETGQMLALKQVRVSGAETIDPPMEGNGSFVIKELSHKAGFKANQDSKDLRVKLDEISIPEGSPYSIVVGVAYAADLRGLTIEASGSQPATAKFGEPIRAEGIAADPQSSGYGISPVYATGKNLVLELLPENNSQGLTVLRNTRVSQMIFEDDGHSSILGGSAHIKSETESGIRLQPSDRLTIRSDCPMLLRELTLKNGELRAILSAPRANTIEAGEDSQRNLMPTLFQWIRYRWPTQLYATLSALVAVWLAIRRWVRSSE
jgi:hypothetical protein